MSNLIGAKNWQKANFWKFMNKQIRWNRYNTAYDLFCGGGSISYYLNIKGILRNSYEINEKTLEMHKLSNIRNFISLLNKCIDMFKSYNIRYFLENFKTDKCDDIKGCFSDEELSSLCLYETQFHVYTTINGIFIGSAYQKDMSLLGLLKSMVHKFRQIERYNLGGLLKQGNAMHVIDTIQDSDDVILFIDPPYFKSSENYGAGGDYDFFEFLEKTKKFQNATLIFFEYVKNYPYLKEFEFEIQTTQRLKIQYGAKNWHEEGLYTKNYKVNKLF